MIFDKCGTRVAFSGGRTSGLMLHRLLAKRRHDQDFVITFANTGREMEETLEFVRDVAINWDVPIRWVEYARTDGPIVKMKGKQPVIGCHGFKEVTFETASRNGEPFRQIIEVKAEYRDKAKDEGPILPNATDRWCSGELKHRTMDRFMYSLGYQMIDVLVGIRYDEPKRKQKLDAQSTQKVVYQFPLFQDRIVEQDVLDFWKKQPFDLKLKHDPELGTFEGNCDFCFLKRQAKLNRMTAEHGDRIDWWAEQEDWTGANFRRGRATFRQMADKRVALELCEIDEDEIVDCFCG